MFSASKRKKEIFSCKFPALFSSAPQVLPKKFYSAAPPPLHHQCAAPPASAAAAASVFRGWHREGEPQPRDAMIRKPACWSVIVPVPEFYIGLSTLQHTYIQYSYIKAPSYEAVRRGTPRGFSGYDEQIKSRSRLLSCNNFFTFPGGSLWRMCDAKMPFFVLFFPSSIMICAPLFFFSLSCRMPFFFNASFSSYMRKMYALVMLVAFPPP